MKKRLSVIFIFLCIFFASTKLYAKEKEVLIINLDTEINGATVSYVDDSMKKAQKEKVDAIIFKIDTYGGRVDAAESIKNKIINSDIKTIAYVDNKAESAGVLLTIACEKVYVSPTATIGSAETVPNTEKSLSFWRSLLRDTAQYRNRNAEIIEAMADSDVVIPDFSKKGKLVNLTSKESLDYGIADGVTKDINDILKLENLENAKLTNSEKSFGVKLVNITSNQMISALLLTLAMVFFVLEIFTPSFGVAGTLSVVSFGLFFLGNIMSGNSSVYSLAIFLLGALLLFIELIVPGFGIPGIAGFTLVLVGLVIGMKTLEIALTSIAAALLVTIVVAYFLIKKGGNSKFAKRITLLESTSSTKGYLSVDSIELEVGTKGKVLSTLKPLGYIIVNGKKYEAISREGLIEKGNKVIIINVENSKIFVEKEN